MPRSHQTLRSLFSCVIIGDHVDKHILVSPLFTLLQPEMLTNDAINDWCDQPQSLRLATTTNWHGPKALPQLTTANGNEVGP
jgi:hypothetical protein